MHLRIEPGTGVPLGTQIARQLKLAIARGRLAPGERLPSARELAAELRVNFHTVRKAYSELERDGILEQARGKGTFVKSSGLKLAAADVRGLAREHLERLLEDLAGSGVAPEALEAVVAKELQQLLQGQRRSR